MKFKIAWISLENMHKYLKKRNVILHTKYMEYPGILDANLRGKV